MGLFSKKESKIEKSTHKESDSEITKLEEIIDGKLKTKGTLMPLASKEVPAKTISDKTGITIEAKREEWTEKSLTNETLLQISERIELIKLLARQLLTEYQIGISPDDEYLNDIANMAIDYYQSHHHEATSTSDRYLLKSERKSWEEEKNKKIKDAVDRLKERLHKR